MILLVAWLLVVWFVMLFVMISILLLVEDGVIVADKEVSEKVELVKLSCVSSRVA